MKITIQGEVRYAAGGSFAENVLVRLELNNGGLAGEVRTDRTGKFAFENITQSQYRISASMPGYRTATQEVNLTTVANEHVILTLVPDKPAQKSQLAFLEDTTIDVRVPQGARDEYEKGRAALLSGNDTAKGIPHLENAVKIYPNFLQAQLLLGTAYLDSHQFDRAEISLKRALAIDPKTSQALLALGEAYRESKKFPDAEAALQEGLKLNDTSWQGHLSLGRLYLDQGNVAKAGPEIGRALQLNPKNAETYLIAGNLLLKAGKADEALQMYQQYLQIAPKGQYAEETQKLVEKIKKAIAEKKENR